MPDAVDDAENVSSCKCSTYESDVATRATQASTRRVFENTIFRITPVFFRASELQSSSSQNASRATLLRTAHEYATHVTGASV